LNGGWNFISKANHICDLLLNKKLRNIFNAGLLKREEYMSLLDRLERRYRRFSIPQLTLCIVVGQVLFFIAVSSGAVNIEQMLLIPGMVLQGEVWRLITFVLIPPRDPIFAFFALYLFYLMGTALENHWGVFRYNIYLLIAYLATVAMSFFTPGLVATNVFIGGSVFLAFAFLYPDFVLYLFFILPIRIKWLALVTWIGYFLTFVFGGWSSRLLVVASVLNFLLFFGKDVIRKVKYGRRHMVRQAKEYAKQDEPLHRCIICGATEKANRELEFRYCGQCKPVTCYCMEHLKDHEHIGGR
jgi:hypothetical protein